MLVGLVNTELRNNATHLDDLVKTHGLDREALKKHLAAAGYNYQRDTRQFR